MFAAPRRFDVQARTLPIPLEIFLSGCRMSIFLYEFPSLSEIAHLLLALEYGYRRLDPHGYTQSKKYPW